MDIKKMLTISTSHITDKSRTVLENETVIETITCLHTLKNGNAGYFVYINATDFKTNIRFKNEIPHDLRTVIAFAIESGCEILCLDDAAEELLCIPHYQYRDYVNNFNKNVSIEYCYCGGGLLKKTELEYRVR